MGNDFHSIAFTPSVLAEQTAHGSRKAYAAQAALAERTGRHERIGADEARFIEARDSFYLASTSETGWPYIQHRGGPPGFLHVLDDRKLGFADFDGNRQYVSVGNVRGNERVCLFLMDYPAQTRLKILGHATLTEDSATLALLAPAGYPAKIERAWLIDVAGFDWNCPKHITPRFTEAEVRAIIDPLRDRIAQLEARLSELRNP